MKISLNVLPEEKKDLIRKRKILKIIINQTGTFLGVVLFGVVLMEIIVLGLHYQRGFLEQDSNKNGGSLFHYDSLDSYEKVFQETNKSIDIFDSLYKGQKRYFQVFQDINMQGTGQIRAKKIDIAQETIIVEGIATTRGDLLRFEENLKGNDCFHNVEIPLSSLVQKENVEFTMTVTYNFSCHEI